MRMLLPIALSLGIGTAVAADPATPPLAPSFDAALAQRTGADARGMRRYVLVAEFHPWYGSAANMLVPEWHDRLVPPAKATP